MARLDRARLERPGAGSVIVVATRYVDLDTQGHVNNAVAAVILQEARAAFTRDLGLQTDAGRRLLVVSQVVEYAAELRYPAPVEVASQLLALGRTSFTVGQVARQGGTAALYSETVIVAADANGPVPLPPELRAAFERSNGMNGGERA